MSPAVPTIATGTTVVMVTHDVAEAVFLGRRVVVPAGDPGRVAAELTVDLPGDRTLADRRRPEFLAMRTRVEDLVRAQHTRVRNAASATAPGPP